MARNTDRPGTPDAEASIDTQLARALLSAQHPDLAKLPIRPADKGWDNAMFRLGDRLALRLPRRALAARLIEREQRWLPELAERLPLAVPLPIRIGQPGCGYLWSWSVVPWLEGNTADQELPRANQGERIAAFLRALHVAAPGGAPVNPYRGVPLAEKAAVTEARIDRLSNRVTATIHRLWHDALAAPIDTAPVWIHGDLHARNVLVKDGDFSGIIDWGDLGVGDRATDLAALWTVLPDTEIRQRAISAYGAISDATWRRAKGWAVFIGVVLLDTGLADHPRHASMGETILSRVREEP